MGRAYQEMGMHVDACRSFQAGLAATRELGDTAGAIRAHGDIGNSYRNLGQHPEALESYQRALRLAASWDDRLGVVRIWGEIGTTFHKLGKRKEALEAQEQVRQRRRVTSRCGYSRLSWRLRAGSGHGSEARGQRYRRTGVQ